ncbi:Voltage-dependent calcium channel gamma-7 subunit-like [Scleropages formosus]|uniref:Voltage-dependent calcium channel gamma-7 subunit-like n=1 Tax=Scleropages formosus TaxID=113540 RepID=A0A0P7WWY5_SCLFO|nr:Voltage-dependent calcium channel gamma-7 subunit-like [Scleropages formosus]
MQKMSSCSSRALTLLSSVFGACGLLLVGVAVSTDYWLLMEEGIVLQQNQSLEVKMALHSGLWRVCFVAEMVRTATPFPMVSLLFVFTGFGAGVMSVYLFMKRYAEEEMYRPHPALYRPRLSECSDYSGQFLHPESWPPPQRGRSASEVSSDISIQLNQTPPPPPPPKNNPQQNAPAGAIGASSGSSSGPSYQMPPPSSYPSHSHSVHSTHTLSHAPTSMPISSPQVLPLAVPPPRYHTHLRMSASPC